MVGACHHNRMSGPPPPGFAPAGWGAWVGAAAPGVACGAAVGFGGACVAGAACVGWADCGVGAAGVAGPQAVSSARPKPMDERWRSSRRVSGMQLWASRGCTLGATPADLASRQAGGVVLVQEAACAF